MRVLKPGGLLVLVVPMNLGHLMLEAGYKAVECDPQAQKTAALSADCQVRRARRVSRARHHLGLPQAFDGASSRGRSAGFPSNRHGRSVMADVFGLRG